jgi:adenylate cyclase class 2
MLDDVEIDIDSWPMIPTYMELEGPSIEKIKEVEELLEVDKDKITTLYADEIASEIYGIDMLAIKELKFDGEKL